MSNLPVSPQPSPSPRFRGPCPDRVKIDAIWFVRHAQLGDRAEFSDHNIEAFISVSLSTGSRFNGVVIRRNAAGELETWMRPGHRFADFALARAIAQAFERHIAPVVEATVSDQEEGQRDGAAPIRGTHG
jgi:hypothetical protein